MAFNSLVLVEPSYRDPRIMTQISQRSGAFSTLPGKQQSIRLGQEDQYVYIRTLQMRSDSIAGQSASNSLNGPGFVTDVIGTPTYIIQSQVQYDGHDTANAGRWNVALPEAYRKAVHQTFAQNERTALLYGFQPANGEGYLNTTGAYTQTLPPDSNGNTTFSTYDNGQLALYFLDTIVSLEQRMYLSGQGSNRLTILGPQRVLAFMLKANIVQLVQFQRDGAGTASSGQVVNAQLQTVRDTVEWCYDDTLEGVGPGGSDAIIFVMPELEDQDDLPGPDTNGFSKLSPMMRDNTMQFVDRAAPTEYTVPLPGPGVVNTYFEKRITSGWVPRPEAMTILYGQAGR